ncbi:hypothetical protein BDW59DRAFT_164449 [Aspergillus cavernicola]|uniref:Velvet domain-containing protein n=1 Tax=Aspergillus cavernicola TaxID=176166 RepID=A0ABR4HZI3_9EURO
MVPWQNGAGTETGSSSREYGLTFEIEPPASVRPGVAFTFPVIVAVRPVGAASNDPLQQLGASVLLRDETGTRSLLGLTGSTTSSVRSRNGNTTSGYARFGPLTLTNPGRYRLRVMLALNTSGGMTTRAFIDTTIIHVHAGAAASQNPTPAQVSRLQSLIPENIDISQADITAWQHA